MIHAREAWNRSVVASGVKLATYEGIEASIQKAAAAGEFECHAGRLTADQKVQLVGQCFDVLEDDSICWDNPPSGA